MKKIKYLVVLILLCFVTTGCFLENKEKNQITNDALEYFSSKYNIDKSKITVNNNNFYGKDERCWMVCDDNAARGTYGDDYQYNEIYNDFYNYLSGIFTYTNRIVIGSLEEDILATPTKYTGNIENYIKNTLIRTYTNNSLHTNVEVLIEVTDSNQAKELNRNYRKQLITELSSFNTSYNILFYGNDENNNRLTFYEYKYISHIEYDAFSYNDFESKKIKQCDKPSFKGEELICD